MSALLQLSGKAEPCAESEECQNLVEPDYPSCFGCKYASRFAGIYNRWRPAAGASKKHPQEAVNKRAARDARRKQQSTARLLKDKARMEIQRLARAAERRTERSIIKATLNSGRVNKNGDHVLDDGSITIDTKMQSDRIHPVVLMGELIKVTQDAMRGGTTFGALLLQNKYKQGVVVMFEEDFAVLIRKLKRKDL